LDFTAKVSGTELAKKERCCAALLIDELVASSRLIQPHYGIKRRPTPIQLSIKANEFWGILGCHIVHHIVESDAGARNCQPSLCTNDGWLVVGY
jgi:hypothetical protein